MLATLPRMPLGLGLAGLALSRLALGVAESLTSTGATMWGIGVAGPEQTARVISWNGVATYSALAIGAPLGALIAAQWGFAAVGAIIAAICVGSYVAATRMAPTAPVKGQHLPLRRILLGVFPYGTGLALGGMGFGVLATFVTLYFAQRGWSGAALALTTFGASFVGARLLFASAIDRFGGFPVALVSFSVEAAGLVLLGLGHAQALAYVGSGLTGLGFSLIFPALAVEAANTFPASVRGSVLGVYTAFVDISLFLAGPMAGAVIGGYGYPAAFLGTAGLVVLALACTAWLAANSRAALAEQAE
jgi:predicted MFS family arabinose efflux permease